MKQRVLKLFLVSVSLGFTALVFMNTYEVVFNRDIVVAKSVKKFQAHDQLRAIIQQFDLKPEEGLSHQNAEYKRLQYIKIPALSASLYLEEKRIIDSQWYVRPNLGHYVGLNKDDHGIIVDYLIYAASSWQTIASPNQIEVGMDVNLFHDGKEVSVFKVAEKKVLPLDKTFVASKSEKRQIILLIEDPKNGVYYAFSLELKD